MKILDKNTQTEISEIFSSLQGEGPYLGVRQIFVRFGRCNMHCHYCDELEKMKAERFTIYGINELLESVDSFQKEKGEHHSVSLTGGEPLFYTPFLKNFLPETKKKGWTVYLETNGTLPRELAEVIRWCDIIAMDAKPVSSTGDRDFMAEHETFIKIALQKDLFIKTVITADTKSEEIRRIAEMIARINPQIPFIFQPQSETFGINSQALNNIEKEFIGIAESLLANVRVIPQMHKIWGVR